MGRCRMTTMVLEWLGAGAVVAAFAALLLVFPVHPVPTSPKCRCPNCKPMREAFKRWERRLQEEGEVIR